MSYPSFSEFYFAVHGFKPYAWQNQLAEFAKEKGVLPDRVEVPTGMGKTSTIDVAVWTLGYQLHHGVPRTMGQRIVHMVERQIVVDGAYSHVLKLAEALDKPTSEATETVATALRTLNAETPLRVTSFHGSRRDSRTWLKVNGAQVIVTTATQVTLRLLGYGPGIARRVSSVHAGLLGLDSVLLFDEPHLATAQVHTIEDVISVQKAAEQGISGVPTTSLTLLGATVPPHLDSDEATRVKFDVDTETGRAKQLWDAPKPVRLLQTDELSGKKLIDATLKLITATVENSLAGAPKIAVMMNSIQVARTAYEQITKLLAKLKITDVSLKLVTSRTRAFDRSDAESLFDESTKPQIVVSTQTLEVGADFSVDLLITELAPWPVLAQRLGRLNRDGKSENPEAIVVIPVDSKGNLGTPAAQSIYGEKQLNATGLGLLEKDVRDASISKQAAIAAGWTDIWPTPPRRPGMSLDIATLMLASSTPAGTKTDLTAWLQGPDTLFPVEPVTVLWRHQASLIKHSPPLPGEHVEVSIAEAKSLVTGLDLAIFSNDAELSEDADAGNKKWTTERLQQVWIRKNNEWAQLRSLSEISPGSTLVLDSSLGGYTEEFGVNPGSNAYVTDISFELSAKNQFRSWTIVPIAQTGEQVKPGQLRWSDQESSNEVTNFADHVASDDWTNFESKQYIAQHFNRVFGVAEKLNFKVTQGAILVKRRFEQSSKTYDVVPLAKHSTLTAVIAQRNAQQAGVSKDVADVCFTAGFLHDHAKVLSGFQKKLGNSPKLEEKYVEEKYVAKELDGKKRDNLACGLPKEFDHALVAARAAEAVGFDEITCHLIGSHHGGLRGIHRGWQDTAIWADRYVNLTRQYGPWGLAWLEANVRVADWEASEFPRALGDREVKPLDEKMLEWIFSYEEKISTTATGNDILLTGLRGPALTLNWYAAVGVLALATFEDPNTKIRWSNITPVLSTVADVKNLVQNFGARWKRICEELSTGVVNAHLAEPGYQRSGKPTPPKLDNKNQRLFLTHQAIEWLADAEWSEETYSVARALWQMQVGRLSPETELVAEGDSETIVSWGTYELPIPLLARNSTVFKNDIEFDPEAVWNIGAGHSDITAGRGAGGLDMPQPGTNELAREYMSRTGLVPLALFGSLSLGIGLEPGGRGTVSDYRRTRKEVGSASVKRHSLELPIPEISVSLIGLSHLTHHGAKLRDGRKIHAKYTKRGNEQMLSAVGSQVVDFSESLET